VVANLVALGLVEEVTANLLELDSLEKGIKEHFIENKHVVAVL